MPQNQERRISDGSVVVAVGDYWTPDGTLDHAHVVSGLLTNRVRLSAVFEELTVWVSPRELIEEWKPIAPIGDQRIVFDTSTYQPVPTGGS